MKPVRICSTALFILSAALCMDEALAQDAPTLTPEVIPESAEGLQDGAKPGWWRPLLVASANFMLGQSKSVPGSPNGVSLNFGYLINGGLGYLSCNERHEWANTLVWQLGYARTPVVDALIKSVDLIDFKSTYLYHLGSIPWMGPFAAFRVSTAMLPGYEVRGADTDVLKLEQGQQAQLDAVGEVVVIDKDGNPISPVVIETVAAGERIELTDAFAPTTLRESVGVFAIPVDKKKIKLDVRVGFGAWETFVRDGYAVEDVEATGTVVELRHLQDSVQMGPEIGLVALGSVKDNVTYSASALAMQPVYHNADTDLEGIDLLNMEFEILLGVKLWEWASLNYSFKAQRQPLIVDAWQIQNNLLLSITASIVD